MLTILDGDKQGITVDGRIAAIVRWLISRRHKVEAPNRVQLTFDCAGQSVSAETREREQVDWAFLR